eukprot:gene4178-761_t
MPLSVFPTHVEKKYKYEYCLPPHPTLAMACAATRLFVHSLLDACARRQSCRMGLTSSAPPRHVHRINGLQWPLDPLQVLSWGFFVLFLVCFVTVQAPFLPSPWNWILAGLYAVLFMYCLCIDLYLTSYNAADPRVYDKRDSEELYSSANAPEVLLALFFLAMCLDMLPSVVTVPRNQCLPPVGAVLLSRYPYSCRKCDKAFIVLLVSLFVAFMMQICVGAAALIYSALHPDHTDSRLRAWYHTDSSRIPLFVFQAVAIALQIAAWIPLSYLLGFHLLLIRQGKTTYQWIMDRRESKRELEASRVAQGLPPQPAPWWYCCKRERRSKASVAPAAATPHADLTGNAPMHPITSSASPSTPQSGACSLNSQGTNPSVKRANGTPSDSGSGSGRHHPAAIDSDQSAGRASRASSRSSLNSPHTPGYHYPTVTASQAPASTALSTPSPATGWDPGHTPSPPFGSAQHMIPLVYPQSTAYTSASANQPAQGSQTTMSPAWNSSLTSTRAPSAAPDAQLSVLSPIATAQPDPLLPPSAVAALQSAAHPWVQPSSDPNTNPYPKETP